MRHPARAAVAAVLGVTVGVLGGLAMYGPVHASAPIAITDGVLAGIYCGFAAFFSSLADRRFRTERVIGSIIGYVIGVEIVFLMSPLLDDAPRAIAGSIIGGGAYVLGVFLGGIIDSSVLGSIVGAVKGRPARD
ncbi:hypothetical protein ACQPZP_12535 [Spirillospora sp. CA-142024]|uniref:hypothetical protein n=1 Tax=Spirillospora sp. CA-142024 TaxID=3240036 RepID=UPI003D91A656